MMSINPVGVTPIGTPFGSGFVRMLGIFGIPVGSLQFTLELRRVSR
jgi:hypothetical protein